MLKRVFSRVCIALSLLASVPVYAEDVIMRITKRYLNLPVSHAADRGVMELSVGGKPVRSFKIRLATEKPDYWVFCDLSEFKGKKLTVSFDGNDAGIGMVYQDDGIAGQDSLYCETNRPQVHYTQRRGWNNDPNGLVYYDGEYHLFYQHNPYEREWENMHWGHAVSRDLIHWEELPVALYPDEHGTMFSGTVVIDYDNASGFGKRGNPAMIAIYTADSPDRQVQCIAYSLDRGRTWTKYDKNPVVDSKEVWNSRDTRDPKVFRYELTGKWVMVLNERDGHSIYISDDLKKWTFESHVTGFWECPELFELPVDGDSSNKKWVMYGASGTYMIGSFDGRKFTPEAGKYYYTRGMLYAAQTFSNVPAEDGRRIQIGWANVNHPGMPFRGTMLLPTVMSLRTTKDGIRLFSEPVKELESIQALAGKWQGLSERDADKVMQAYNDVDCLRVRTTIKLSHATSAGLALNGQNLLDYDMNRNSVNGVFYSPEDMTSMEISVDIIIDRTLVEVFVDGGVYSYSMERHHNNAKGFDFWGNNIEVRNLEVYTLDSIWN